MCSILHVDLSLIVFYCGVKAAKDGVWLTDSIFLIFVRGHIHIAYHPPVPTPTLAFSPAPATQRSSVCRIFE